ncbi:MAG: hypothetical protein MZW92_37560 [Comamonadaceae bacterium]|nr:hypothetical protein [Comamonadaceae bacterium]
MPWPLSLTRIIRRPPLVDLQADIRCPGIQCVFDQFLNHRGGAFHHLAGGDLVGQALGQYRDAWRHSYSMQKERASPLFLIIDMDLEIRVSVPAFPNRRTGC